MDMRKVRRSAKKRIYIHNTLSNGAHYFKGRISDREGNSNLDGITFDYISALLLLSFSFEAKVNFVGHKLIDGWNERKCIKDKVKIIYRSLGIEKDWGKEPLSTVNDLIEFRNTLAHGKPVEVIEDVVIEKELEPGSELDKTLGLSDDWEKLCNQDFVSQAYDAVKKIWDTLLKNGDISLHETLSSAFGTVTILDE